jgi:hypothetical protein
MKTLNNECGAAKSYASLRLEERRAKRAVIVPAQARRTGHWEWPLLAARLLVATSAKAQTNYAIDWSNVDGGGGTSTGATYQVSGTIGQPDN